MIKRLLVFSGLLMLASLAYAQTPHRSCAAQEVHEQKMKNDPQYRANREAIEAQYEKYLRSGATNAATGVRTIPVYVHVIYNTAQENISDAQIQSQIAVLNEDYSASNSDISNVPSEFAGSVADYGIQFQLVQITRKQSSKTEWGTNDAMKKSSQGGIDPITPDTHMNMWICNIGGGILGYAQFPGGDPSTDGVVFSPQYCGSSDYDTNGTFYLSAPFDKGRTATHEVGHYLNLRHIWGDGNCSQDDFVSDTPTASAANYGCPSYPSKSCNSNGGFTSDMFMNYMDYVDDACMYMFTNGQKTRTAAIFAAGGARENLGTVGGGCSLAAPNGLAASSIGDNGFTLSWNAVSGADSYTVSINGSTSTVTGTTYTASGLTAGTDYTCNIVANCAGGGSGSVSSNLVVTTTGSNCKTGPAELSITFDNYPSETSWTVTLNGSQVASGSGYGSGDKGTTITESLDYGAGDYVFTINDSYGDGMCCSYGNGAWSITDGSSNVIASGGSYTSSESASFCIEGSTGDTQAPTTPGSLSASGVTQTAANLSWSASSDNVGVTGYDVYVNGSVDGSTTSTSYSLSGLTAATTYNVSVVAKDAAGNQSSAATTSFTTQSAGISCSSTVSLPYAQGFESGFGGWTQVSGDDFDWARNSGGTPSSSTGPSAAQEGSYYIYVEASSPNYSNKTTIIESPCVDLSGESAASFSFKYHMYGATVGSLQLQASTDGSSWSSVWSKSGNQGNSWATANVDLAAYLGGIVKLRFVGTTGSSYTGDMAVDNLSISAGGSTGGTTTVSLSITFDNYPEETSWEIRDGSTVVASGGTYGSQADGSTINENIDLADGCYDFVILDAYGDGICCSYGSGSYTLTSGGTTLASGGSFGSSETTNFCVGSGARAYARNTRTEGTAPAGFEVFPNPAKEKITIYTGKMESPQYVIINATGRIWQQGKITGNQSEINVSNLKSGFYMVKVTDGQNTIVHKMVKQ